MASLQALLNPTPNFNQYADIASAYLNRDIFKGTPLTGTSLSNAAKTTYDKYGVYIPPEFALAQAQLESKMGLLSRNAKTNPFNVGEFDEGTKQRFATTQQGVDAYYDLIARDYLTKGKKIDDLLINYVNKAGNRYASNPEYEQKMRSQVDFIKRYSGGRSKQSSPKAIEEREGNFKDAFASARKSGKSEFEFNGKKYSTRVK